ncbi:DNA-binding protein [Nakamurella antarctica]|uniref:DNA-binding protein n=1 Tax=Nakamurella antarctica TaxID=1902245 RepID=A0A3G8ZKA5_9ACTN|nr:OB-fold nucleic acid binding domain-containing protein [Nakamurella antarctica]AZI57693.1 DNA-binding protein [Nakamurella antarctica]
MAGSLSRWLKKLGSDDDQLEAAALTTSSEASGAQHASVCTQGQRVTVQGRLRSVDLRPADALATLVAELYDGTDAVELVWLGRRSIPGIEPGRTIQVTGRISVRNGRKCIYNPNYELRPVRL